MTYIEENASKQMEYIFSSISNEQNFLFECYFAADMMKVNKKDCVFPCFIGFNDTCIAIVQINSKLEKEDITLINRSSIKNIKVRKLFLSKNFYLIIECTDHTFYKISVPYSLKYIHMQSEHVEKFLQQYYLK